MPDSRTPTAAELLAHTSFLRRLAGDLVGPADAADLVQAAWARALERPPRERVALRAWLATVVRNLAHNVRRGEDRRRQRERQVAREERVEAGGRALERLELQRLLGELVVALPEPQRTVLYLRYFEGLTPSAIATRLALPVKTVKSRHTRALAALRERLDERSKGDRAAWMAALGVWRRPSVTLTGGALAAGVVGLVVGAFVVLQRLLASEPAASLVATTDARGSTEASARADLVAADRVARAPEEVARDTSESAPSVLEGRVWLPDRAGPLSGVELEVSHKGGDRWGTERISTDAEGRFRLEWPHAVSVWRVVVHPTASTTALEGPGLRISPGETEALELVTRRGATIEGRVVGPNERVVPGARVLAWSRPYSLATPPDRVVESDLDGRFRLEHVGEQVFVRAEAAELVCAIGLQGRLADELVAQDVRIEMAAPHVFRGHVVDERGRPVVGARLSRSAQQGWSSNGATHVPGLSLWQASAMEGTSDAAGGFELGPYSYERTSVRVEHPEHPFVDLPIDALRPDNELVVPTGGVLHGTVTGCDGRPAVGARVSVGSGTQGRASTDGAGRFELRGLKAAEEAFVHVEAAGNALFALQPLRIARGENELALVLAPPKVLAGRVVDAAGAAVVDARVHIEGDRLVHYVDIDHGEKTTWEWFAGRNEVRTDRRGAFRFADLYDGEFALSVHPEGLPGRRAHVRARAGEEALEIVLGAGAPSLGFVGTVRDARTGAAIEEFTFYVERPDDVPEPDASARVDFENGTIEIVIIESWTGTPAAVERESNGAFRVTGLDPGHLRVQIAAEGYVPFQGEARDHGPGEVVLHARLVPACTLRVEVGDPSEVQGNTTTLRFEDLDGRTLLYGSSHNRHSDLHVRAPSVAVEGLPCGPVRLRASRSGCRDLELDLDLATLGDEPVRLCMQRER